MDSTKDPNAYDFEFEDNDEIGTESIDDIDGWDADNDPVLNALLEVLSDVKEKWDNVNKLRVPNPTKLIEFMKSYKLLVEIVRSEDKDAKIKCELNDWLDTGRPCVNIETDIFTISDMENFRKIAKNINLIEVMKLTTDMLSIDIQFHNIYDTYLEQDPSD